jgi:hypothetical protein
VPFLRFSKDRRGYENTYLLKPSRRGEREAPVLLYWFRTPPFVKMGRAALDEETVRLLEDQHPHLEFDWPRILASQPQPSEPVDPAAPPRPRRRSDERTERPAPPRPAARRPEQRPEQRPEYRAPVSIAQAADPPVVESPALAPVPQAAPPVEELSPLPAPGMPFAATFTEAPREEEPAAAPRRFMRVFDAPIAEVPPERRELGPPPGRLSEPSVIARLLGSEQLLRLRGRYAAAMARIARRITDPAQADSLRSIAERANPDAWVTENDVRVGLAGLDQTYAELLPLVGRRRRRRRGGRDTTSDAAEGGSPATAGVGSESASDSPPDSVPDEQDDGDEPPE